MRTDIQPHFFFHWAYPQSDTHIKRLSQHIGHPKRKNDGDNNGNNLNAKLGSITEKQTVGSIGVNGYRSQVQPVL